MNNIALYDGIAKIVFEDKCLTEYVDFEYDEPLKFAKVLEIAKSNGYANGCILLICENHYEGYVYRYGNYTDGKWWQIGTTCGFA